MAGRKHLAEQQLDNGEPDTIAGVAYLCWPHFQADSTDEPFASYGMVARYQALPRPAF